MREVLVGITESQERDLGRLARRTKRSRAALIREAIDGLLARHQSQDATEAFGLWGSATPDGLDFQRSVRSEW